MSVREVRVGDVWREKTIAQMNILVSFSREILLCCCDIGKNVTPTSYGVYLPEMLLIKPICTHGRTPHLFWAVGRRGQTGPPPFLL